MRNSAVAYLSCE